MLLIALAVILIVWLVYKLWTMPYNYWKKKGFPHIEARFPFGSSTGLALLNEFQGKATLDVYNKLAPHPYGGIVILRRPYLVLRDLNIIKMIMVKDFDYFRDRTTVDNIKEPISEHIFNLGGEKWRVKRVNLGPIFSASKVKSIFPFYHELKNDLFGVLDKSANDGESFDAKFTMSRFTVDFIGSWAFGSRIDSLQKPDHILLRTGSQFFPSEMTPTIKAELSVFNLISGLEDSIRFPFIPPELAEAVDAYTEKGIEAREASSEHRTDLIDILIKLKNKGILTSDRVVISDGVTQKVTENKMDVKFHDLSGEALILFSAGFDTTSTAISCALYELAFNPAIQDRLIEEVDKSLETHGVISYQALQEMTYLDQVISETLRKYPPVPVLTRKCVKEYSMSDRPELTIERGTRVIIPLLAIHMDPDLFPDPESFNPDRFAPENKDSILPYSYMPFGEGPRYCIGKRIGLLQSKMGVALTLSRYRVFKSHLTPNKIRFESTLLVLTSKTPIWLKLEMRKRQKSS